MTSRALPIQAELPKTVRVGAHRFRLVFKSERAAAVMRGLNGLCDFDAGVIYINREHARDHSPDRVLTTVLHEIAHAITHVYGVRDESDEEGFVTGFSLGFVAFLVDNPEFLLWMNKVIAQTIADHAKPE